MVETASPARSPQAITIYPETAGIADSIPAVMPTPIPITPKGIITSNAPTKGMRRILSGRTSTIPVNPPRTIAMNILGGKGSKNTTSATSPPAHVPMKKSIIFKFTTRRGADEQLLFTASNGYSRLNKSLLTASPAKGLGLPDPRGWIIRISVMVRKLQSLERQRGIPSFYWHFGLTSRVGGAILLGMNLINLFKKQ